MRRGVNRSIAVAVTAGVFALAGVLAGRLAMEEDVTALLPSDDPVIADYRLVATRFRALDSLFIDVGAESASAPRADVAAAADALVEQLQSTGLFERIHYRVSPEGASAMLDTLSARRACLQCHGPCGGDPPDRRGGTAAPTDAGPTCAYRTFRRPDARAHPARSA